MKTRNIIICSLATLGAAWSSSSCYSEAKFGLFDQAEVLSFVVDGEASPSLIFRDEQRIQVSLEADVDLTRVTVTSLQISTLAKANVREGDQIDLSEDFELVVTAEDGAEVIWMVTASLEGQPPSGTGGAGGSDGGDGDGDGPPPSGTGGAGGSDGGDGDGDGDGPPEACPSTVAIYELSGRFELTDTPGGLGNGVFTIGPGEVTLRFVPQGLGQGIVSILAYEMPQQFSVEAPGALTVNDSFAEAGPDACGLSRGQLASTTVSWQKCDYGLAPPQGTTKWSASDIVGGLGCLNNYRVTGQVTCSGAFCSLSGVDFPLELNDLYPQPLNAFEFSDDFSTFSMTKLGAPASNPGISGVELPNQEPSRSWLGLSGTLVSSECAPLPDCP